MELLQQDQTAGKYAHMLREILRKMSKNDSDLKLKSLETVLKLGESILIDSENKKSNERNISPDKRNNFNESSNPNKFKNSINAKRKESPVKNKNFELVKDFEVKSLSVNKSPVKSQPIIQSNSNKDVKGKIPNVSKTPKKAFGHPI